MYSNQVNVKMEKRINYLDFCKGVAIFMVIMVHFTARLHDLNPIIKYFGLYGQMGCQLFFVISAYFAVSGIEKYSSSFRNYIVRKLKRLMPCYILAVLMHVPVIIILRDCFAIEMNWPSTSFINIIGNLFFAQHYTSYFTTLVTGSWFIFCILLFYVVLWFLWKKRWITSSNIRNWIISTFLCEVMLGIMLIATLGENVCENNSVYYCSIIVQFPVLLCGIKLFFDFKNANEQSGSLPYIAIILLYVITMWLFCIGSSYAFLVIPLFSAIMFCYFIRIIKMRYLKIWGGYRRLFETMGKYSYELLIVHVYPVSYGTRMIYVMLDKFNIGISGNVMFFVCIIPMTLISIMLAILLHKAVGLMEGFVKSNCRNIFIN